MSILSRPSPLRALSATTVAALVLACGEEPRQASRADADTARTEASRERAPAVTQQEEPKQWTFREVAKRLTDGGLVVTDSGRTAITHSFLAVEGRLMRVSGSDLQVFIYPDPSSRRADSERIDTTRVAPDDAIIDWIATPHLIASGNLVAIHLTPNERLAERVRLILEAWHAGG